eukprot:SAG31_NODE_4972_length_2825_cov_2.318782_2_plen_190_part_00
MHRARRRCTFCIRWTSASEPMGNLAGRDTAKGASWNDCGDGDAGPIVGRTIAEHEHLGCIICAVWFVGANLQSRAPYTGVTRPTTTLIGVFLASTIVISWQSHKHARLYVRVINYTAPTKHEPTPSPSVRKRAKGLDIQNVAGARIEHGVAPLLSNKVAIFGCTCARVITTHERRTLRGRGHRSRISVR